ncbi:alpha/beta hydrolase [uncultured Eubacterium sp.]|uniref:alpha/beta hydrolase n=1 Tax=uncultured Eubacterium sp. TaxID=165185 RepID=UPI00261D623B|nr:alpha/beta hydrolase [uncultured Eubacterium sp.]
MNKKGMGAIFGTICGLTALTAISAEIFYDFSINTKSPIHMSKLNNLVQKATNTNGSEEDASAKYSGLTGTPEMKKWYGENGEDVYIMSDLFRLHGKLFKNPGTKYALVCHGYTSKAKHMAGFVNKFHSLGYNVLAVDARAHGDSEGTKIGMGWVERFDVIEWINYIISLEPDAQIILHGVSMGASTVLMASGEELPKNVKAIIADCGYTSEWDEFRQEADVLHIPWFPVLNASSAISKIRDGYDFKQASAVEQVKKSHTPTLFIHGSEDELVPYGMLNELYSAANCEKEILTIQGAGHALSSSVAPELYWNTVEAFLEKHLEK